MFFLGVDISGTRSLLVGGYVHGVGMSMGCVRPTVCTHPQDMEPQGGGYVRGRWVHTHPSHRIQHDTVGKRAVRILLECFLVFGSFDFPKVSLCNHDFSGFCCYCRLFCSIGRYFCPQVHRPQPATLHFLPE